jgi:5-methylcytosine-specific restriction endonuclease McrA
MARSSKIRNARKRARLKLNFLLIRQKFKCHYCGRRIARPHQLRGRIIAQTVDQLIYLNSTGELTTIGVATADHMQPLMAGGTSHIRNLVAACWGCNMERHRQARKGGVEVDEEE